MQTVPEEEAAPSSKPTMEHQPFAVPASRLDNIISQREAIVSKFVKSLGFEPPLMQKKGSVGDFVQSVSKIFLEGLSGSVVDHDVVCTVPSLDLYSGDTSKDARANPLPGVGVSHGGEKKGNIPQMAASVLTQPDAQAGGETKKLEQTAAQHLSSTTSWTKSSLIYAPGAIAKNMAASFKSLVESRIKAWTVLLLRHSLQSGDNGSRNRLLSMLSSSVHLNRVTTAFTTLPLPPSARGLQQEYDVILPLLFEAKLNAGTKGEYDDVVVRAPGTISANFAEDELGLVRVDVRLDTAPLLESLVEQARLVVFKAVARATKADEKAMAAKQGIGSSTSISGNSGSDKISPLTPRSQTPSSLNLGFKSALNLSSTPETQNEPMRLKKARSSALRLNQILHGSGKSEEKNSSQHNADVPMMNEPLSKTRKTRSVRWNHPMEAPSRDTSNFPDAKRQRMIASAAKLRSTKSFGKPYAAGSQPGNATFGEFGRISSSDPIWGRDGKLRFHPTPDLHEQQDLSPGAKSNVNASFENQRTRLSSLHGLTRNSRKSEQQSAESGAFARTATALEGWLLSSATGKRGGGY